VARAYAASNRKERDITFARLSLKHFTTSSQITDPPALPTICRFSARSPRLTTSLPRNDRRGLCSGVQFCCCFLVWRYVTRYLATFVRSAATVVKITFSEPPMAKTIVMIATTTAEAIRPYSIEVPPELSCARRLIMLITVALPILRSECRSAGSRLCNDQKSTGHCDPASSRQSSGRWQRQ
jgi:hypothetical protein